MGNNCSTPHDPVYDNQCSVANLVTYDLPGYCDLPFPPDQDPCKNISPEWTLAQTYKCCDDKISVICQRTSFNGDPRQCCVNNYESTETYDLCFSDSAKKRTCDPIYRGIETSGCRTLFANECVQQTSDSAYTEQWTKDSFCTDMVAKNSRLPSGEVNRSGLSWLTPEMRRLLNNYFQDGILREGIGGTFQDIIYKVCKEYPEACDLGLYDVCGTYTRDSALGNTNIVNICGCHMNNSVYALYNDLYGVSKQCDPLCNRTTTIQETVNYEVQLCLSSLCIIDDVTINLVESSVGNINFTQACGGCASTSSQCNCIISGISIDSAESELGNINLEQYCTGSLKCYAPNPADPYGPAIEVPCSESSTVPTPEELEKQREAEALAKRRTLVVIIVLVLFVILIITLVLMVILLNTRRTPEFRYLQIVDTPYGDTEAI